MGGNGPHGRRCRAKLTRHKHDSHTYDEYKPTKNLSRREEASVRCGFRGTAYLPYQGWMGHLATLQVAEWSTGQTPRTLVIALVHLARL